ncbi:MAG TPA: PD-(D/E)XK nuclease family protein [Acidimicrobiales bacterium]
MPLELPTSLSPSKVSSFTECALAFRFSAIDRLPDPPTVATVKGTLVHATLERLMLLEPAERDVAAALGCLVEARTALSDDPEWIELALDTEGEAALVADAEVLVRRYFEIEDPTTVHPIGIELRMEVELEGLMLRGIIDRLELDADGELVVTDYKSGRAPTQAFEQSRLGGVHFYAFLCERLLGRRPSRVQLLYLSDPVAITTVPTEQSIRQLERKVRAIWNAIEKACERDDFRPKQSRLCNWCAFQTYCPSFGGDPDQAREVAATLRSARAGGEIRLAGGDEGLMALPLASAG